MNKPTLLVHVEGLGVKEGRIPLRYLTHFGRQFQMVLERTGRVLAGQASGQRGRTPEEIRAACNLHVIAFQEGSFAMALDLPRSQLALPGLDFGEQALEHALVGLERIRENGAELPKGYDLGVLVAWRDLGRLLQRDVQKVRFDLHTTRMHRSVTYDVTTYARVVELIEGPLEDRAVLEGRLLMADFKATGFRCRLHPPAAKPVLCTFNEALTEEIADALRHYVRVIGLAEKNPQTGEIRELTIRAVEVLDLYGEVEPEEQTEPVAVSVEPADFWTGVDRDTLAERQGVEPVQRLESLWGDFWPDEDSVDEFIATVRAWRRQDITG